MNKLYVLSEVENIYKNAFHPQFVRELAEQLADSMRENKRLREALKTISEGNVSHGFCGDEDARFAQAVLLNQPFVSMYAEYADHSNKDRENKNG